MHTTADAEPIDQEAITAGRLANDAPCVAGLANGAISMSAPQRAGGHDEPRRRASLSGGPAESERGGGGQKWMASTVLEKMKWGE